MHEILKVHDSYNNRHNVFVGGIEGEKTSAAVSNGIILLQQQTAQVMRYIKWALPPHESQMCSRTPAATKHVSSGYQ